MCCSLDLGNNYSRLAEEQWSEISVLSFLIGADVEPGDAIHRACLTKIAGAAGVLRDRLSKTAGAEAGAEAETVSFVVKSTRSTRTRQVHPTMVLVARALFASADPATSLPRAILKSIAAVQDLFFGQVPLKMIEAEAAALTTSTYMKRSSFNSWDAFSFFQLGPEPMLGEMWGALQPTPPTAGPTTKSTSAPAPAPKAPKSRVVAGCIKRIFEAIIGKEQTGTYKGLVAVVKATATLLRCKNRKMTGFADIEGVLARRGHTVAAVQDLLAALGGPSSYDHSRKKLAMGTPEPTKVHSPWKKANELRIHKELVVRFENASEPPALRPALPPPVVCRTVVYVECAPVLLLPSYVLPSGWWSGRRGKGNGTGVDFLRSRGTTSTPTCTRE